MLDFALERPIEAADDYFASQQKPIGTVFEYPIDIVTSFKSKDANPLDATPLVDSQSEQYGTDQSFKRTIDVPNVLGLDLTDKSTTGIFEGGSSFKARDSNPVDATQLNNASVDGLGTGIIDNQSPLGANFHGQNVLVQGTDSANAALFYPPSYGATPQLEDTSTTPDLPATKPSDCSWYDVPCKFGSIKGEVTILIVGLILLAVGIFALTR